MIEGMHAPDRNRHGIVIPPHPAKITPAKLAFYSKKAFTDRHHLYFPRVSFREHSKLAFEFREHHTNSVWLPRFQHDKLHLRYDPLVRKYPDYLVPPEDVMATFMDEVGLLDELGVCMSAVNMIDEAIYEGRVKHIDEALENRESRIGRAAEIVQETQRFEIVAPWIARPAIESAAVMLNAA
jgi:hypothetical protein